MTRFLFPLFSRYLFFNCRSNPRLFSQPQPCIPKPQVLLSLFFIFCYSPSPSHVSRNRRFCFLFFIIILPASACIPKPQAFFPLFFRSFVLFSQPQPYLPPLRTQPPHHHPLEKEKGGERDGESARERDHSVSERERGRGRENEILLTIKK